MLTPKQALELVPGHGRTSCSDDKPINGYRHYPNGGTRCARCGLLEAAIQYPRGPMKWDPDDYEIEVIVEFRWKGSNG